jgi:hypothetical protein
VTLSEPGVVEYLNLHYIPWKIDYDVETGLLRRYDVHMVPTVVFCDEKLREHYRHVGFLPPRRFLGHLALGRAKIAFGKRRYREAADLFGHVADDFPDCSVAPEAIFYRGISRDKLSEDHSNRKISAAELDEKCPDTDWAARASVWL